jgi:hypothetical protein
MPSLANPIAPSPRRTREVGKRSQPWFAKDIWCAREPTKIQNKRVPMTQLAGTLPWPVEHSYSAQTTRRQNPHRGQHIRSVFPTARSPGAIQSTDHPLVRMRTSPPIRPRSRSQPRSLPHLSGIPVGAPCLSRGSAASTSRKESPKGVCVIAAANRNRTGAPGSPKRTWAEKDGRPGFPARGTHQRRRVRLSVRKAA